MSAWVVSKTHIDTMVAEATRAPYGKPRGEADRLGRLLWEENHASVRALYEGRHGSGEACPPYRFDPVGALTDPVVVLKAIDCYEYQSCEHDGWEESEARKLCQAIRGTAIGRLSGYDAAPWGIEGRK